MINRQGYSVTREEKSSRGALKQLQAQQEAERHRQEIEKKKKKEAERQKIQKIQHWLEEFEKIYPDQFKLLGELSTPNSVTKNL